MWINYSKTLAYDLGKTHSESFSICVKTRIQEKVMKVSCRKEHSSSFWLIYGCEFSCFLSQWYSLIYKLEANTCKLREKG